jgi:hypothetical protein
MKVYPAIAMAAFLMGAAGNADAARLQLVATGIAPDATDLGFDVLFDDTGDGLLQFEEIISSSGFVFPDGGAFPALLGVPNVADVSTAGGPCDSPDRWCFVNTDEGLAVTIDTTDFTYVISVVAVAEPEMLSLFTLAVGGLLMRLRHRRKVS